MLNQNRSLQNPLPGTRVHTRTRAMRAHGPQTVLCSADERGKETGRRAAFSQAEGPTDLLVFHQSPL